MKVITILNQKGGTGKTTIATSVTARLSNRGYNVILIDADFTQESAMTWAEINEGRYFEVVVMKAAQIKNFLLRNEEVYDYVIIDCPPRANEDTAKFVNVSHLVVIPVQPSPYDVWACKELIEIIQQRKELTRGLPDLPKDGLPVAAFVLSRATKGTRIIGETADALHDVGFHILSNMTTQYDVYKRAPITGHTIFDAPEPQPRAEEQMIGITDEILELLP